MEQIPFKKPKGPWYDHFDFWSEIAYKYLHAFRKIPPDAKHHAELRAFSLLMGFRLVFESNLIEGAGLSRGETRKVIEEYFPHIPNSYEAFRQLQTLEQHMIPQKDATTNDIELTYIIPSVTFESKSKGIREVVQHYKAYTEAFLMAFDFIKRMRIKTLIETGQKEEFPQDKESLQLLTEENINILHTTIAKQLLPEDAKVKAGEYRIDIRTVGDFEVVFPSPELIPDCMKKFIEDANALFFSYFSDNVNIFEVAARISYDFVRIHPFPDFNGRLSRLLLAMVLHAYGLPFAITLRGDKKGRHRYFISLQRANNHKIIPYAALIAMRVAETFQEIDENIIRANYPSILSFA